MKIYPEETVRSLVASCLVSFYLFIIAIVMIIMLSGCKSVQYVPVETVKHDSIYINKWQRDSIYLQEFVNVYQKADTVYRDKLVVKYKELLRTDTTYVERIDTLNVYYPVEKELTTWQKRFIDIGKGSLCLLAILLLAGVIWLVVKLK